METVVYINSETLGNGPEELGRVLIRNFLLTVSDSGESVGRIILVNSGVKLACEGSHVLDVLHELAGRGTKIASCGTCLDFFGLREKLRAGEVGNMKGVVQALFDQGAKVVRP